MNFKYKARNTKGGVIEGKGAFNSRDELIAYLRGQSLIPLSVEADTSARGGSPAGGAPGPAMRRDAPLSLWEKMKRIGTVPSKVRMVFFRQLATMLRSGLNLASGLDIIEQQETNLIFRDIITNIKRRIDSGNSLSQALRANKGFTPLMISLVHAGEESGRLEQGLDRVANILEKTESLKRKVKSALTYPAVIMVFALVIVYIFITFILPKFEQVFAQLKIQLPPLTVFMFNLSKFIESYALIIFASIVAILFAINLFGRTPTGRDIYDRIKLKLPILKSVIFRAMMVRSTQTLSAMVNAGVPILNGLEMAGNVADNTVARRAWISMMDAARRGQSLAISSANTGLFPPMVTQMIRVGEETGQLDDMLARVAVWYEEELDAQVKALTAMMEPALIIVVGGLVSVIALSIYGPMISAMEQLM